MTSSTSMKSCKHIWYQPASLLKLTHSHWSSHVFLSEWDSREGFLISAGQIAGLLDLSCFPCGWLPHFTTLLQENLFNHPQMCYDGTSDVIWSDPLLFSVPYTYLQLKAVLGHVFSSLELELKVRLNFQNQKIRNYSWMYLKSLISVKLKHLF